MAPLKVVCPNCEDEALTECEADGELAGYICAGASESERETKSGCGALVSSKEYKQLKAEAEAKAKKGASSSSAGSAVKNNTAPSSVVRTLMPSSAGKPGLGMRRPLPSLHSGGAARSSLHTPLQSSLPAKPAPVVSSTADAIATPASANHTPASSASSSSVSVQKAAAKPIVSKPAAAAASKKPAAAGADSGDSSSSDDDEDGEDGSSSSDDDAKTPSPPAAAAAKPKKSAPVVSSTSTTPTKLPSSTASTPQRATKAVAKGKKGSKTSPVAAASPVASFNLADPTVSKAERERALKKKLAAARAAREAEFAEKYGAEGDADTAEEKANAARKGSGQAGEDFLACSQEGGEIKRAPLVEGLSVKDAVLFPCVRKPWTMPRAHGSMSNDAIALVEARAKAQFVVGRRLGARARIFSGAFTGFKALDTESLSPPEQQAPPPPVLKVEEKKVGDAYEPLPIWTPTPEELALNPDLTPIEVPHLVCKWLRPHQREGVKFMAECVLGQRNLGGAPPPAAKPAAPTPAATVEEGAEGAASVPPPPPPPPACTQHAGAGAILADDMGLGKTLQSVGLVYTLLTQGFVRGQPVARKVIIVTPTSLVANWRNEIDKWLGKGVLNVVALSEVGKDNIECGMDTYTAWNSKSHVLIVSYDTFRRYVDKLKKPGLCDLLICDEAHRLKNNKTSTYTALDSLPCKRRVLLSGTPMQNDLSEFFSMINFTNRGIIGDRKAFRKYYELPILMGREPECLEEEAATGAERSAELSAIVNQFVLRRTNVLLKKHLPPKVIQIVCVRPSALQVALYQHFLASKSVRSLTSGDEEGSSRSGGGLQALPLITSLKKLVNHPKLIYDSATACAKVGAGGKGVSMKDEEGNVEKVPPALVSMFKSMKPIFEKHDGGGFLRNPSSAIYSGKMFVLERLLMQIRASSTDRMVIVSNFTSALDVIATMCTLRKWDYLRLDGTTSIKKRQQLVDQLSDHRGNRVFVFLLSSRAGGCGLNLIGANRLILFDPDWNPAVDKQAAARVWRDGQQKRCFIYRFLCTGTIEEKIYQRQLSKEGLSGVLGGSTADASLSKDELRDLFRLDARALELPSDTHTSTGCDCLDCYAIQTEEEANKAEAAHKAEAEKHAKELAAAEEAKRAEGGEGADAAMDDVEPGAPASASLAAASSSADGASKMEVTFEGGGEGGAGEGEGDDGAEGEGAGAEVDSSSDDANDDGADLDGFVVDSDDDDADFGEKKGKKGAKAAAPKRSKKDGPRKQRKARSRIGSLNYPALNALETSTRGQRGEPPEEELVNWAHHATANSIPDPLFRQAARGMPLVGAGKLPYVSFVFSCEIAGKAITNSNDAADAQKVSAMCDEAPQVVPTTKPQAVISSAEAMARHAEFMKTYLAKQKKSRGIGSDEEDVDLMAHPEKRRHSTRERKPVRNDVPHAPEIDEDFEGGTGTGRKRKKGSSSGAIRLPGGQEIPEGTSDADRDAMILALGGVVPRGGGRKKASPRKSRPPTKKAQSEEEEEENEDEDEQQQEEGKMADIPEEDAAADKADDSSSVQETSPPKKLKVAHNTPVPSSSLEKLKPSAAAPAAAAPAAASSASAASRPAPKSSASVVSMLESDDEGFNLQSSSKSNAENRVKINGRKVMDEDDEGDDGEDSDVQVISEKPASSKKPVVAASPVKAIKPAISSSIKRPTNPSVAGRPTAGLKPAAASSSPARPKQDKKISAPSPSHGDDTDDWL